MSVVLPVREPASLPLMLRGLPPVDEVVVVAEAGTAAAAAARALRPGAVLVSPTRPGLGNALACGIAASRGDVVVTLNGDGSTDPADIPRFVAALVAGADMATGSRYSAGGRDLTGGRFRRWADLILLWCLNALLGTRRTDPGFGYAAFWRDALAHLDLPDPAVRAGAAWGEGPEIGPLLALRPAARGLRVTEIPSVAYPPLRRAQRADRPRLHHWLRTALRERGDRRSYVSPAVVPATPRVQHGPGFRLEQDGPEYRITPERTTADVWRRADRRAPGEPIWGPPHRRAAPPRDLWRERRALNEPLPPYPSAHPEPLLGPDVQPRSTEDSWLPLPRAPKQPGEVGARRRRIPGTRQSQPDLRVINGEGTGPGGRRGRLRSVKKP